MSDPFPPLNASSPLPPASESSPSSPFRVSFPSPPLIESLPAPPEMTYQRIDPRTYELVGQSRGITLTFNSNQPIQQFMGDAMDRLGITQGR